MEEKLKNVAERMDAVASLVCRSPVAVICGILAYAGGNSLFEVGTPDWWVTNNPTITSSFNIVALLILGIGIKGLLWSLRPLKRLLAK